MSEKLLPCPFCGGSHVVVCENEGQFDVYCPDWLLVKRPPLLNGIAAPPQVGRADKPSDHAPARAESVKPHEHVDDPDEAYELGKQEGYQDAIQELDIATGGDGEFVGSTFAGETVDVPVMRQRIIDRVASPPQPDRNTGERLLSAAKLLLANSIACVELHHGVDVAANGLPGWLAGAKRDIENTLTSSTPTQTATVPRKVTPEIAEAISNVLNSEDPSKFAGRPAEEGIQPIWDAALKTAEGHQL